MDDLHMDQGRLKLQFERPLFLGVHPDDNLLGCGGFLSRLKRLHREFYCYTFTCNNGTRKKEWTSVMKYLCPTEYCIYDYRGDALPDHSYEVRTILEGLKRDLNPDIVFTHSRKSLHQSHVALSEEVERIMRNISVLSHEGIKGGPHLVPNFFIEISEEEVEEKLKLLSFIESESKKYFLQQDLIKSVARVLGARIGVKYAEAFEVVRFKV